jgi:hypothetical protein
MHPRLRERKHTTRIKIISHHKTWELILYLFYAFSNIWNDDNKNKKSMSVKLYWQTVNLILLIGSFWLGVTQSACIRLIVWWMLCRWVDGCRHIGYLLCVIKSFQQIYADILQTLHNCYGHIEDVYVNFWKCSDIFLQILRRSNGQIEDVHTNFWKSSESFFLNLHVVELNHFSNMFWIDGT